MQDNVKSKPEDYEDVGRPETWLKTKHARGRTAWSRRRIPKLKHRPLSAVRNCLFSIFITTLHCGECLLQLQLRVESNSRLFGTCQWTFEFYERRTTSWV